LRRFVVAPTDALSAEWSQEPTSFLGIKLDVPLASQLSLCFDKPKAMCYEWTGVNAVVVRNAPYFGIRADVFLSVHGANWLVGEVQLHISHDDAQRMLNLLTAKYGKPHQTEATRAIK
jgi:hypothetical protein